MIFRSISFRPELRVPGLISAYKLGTVALVNAVEMALLMIKQFMLIQI
jgi:uncharacterized circularly permuted ATP-grasp superfamily protein